MNDLQNEEWYHEIVSQRGTSCVSQHRQAVGTITNPQLKLRVNLFLLPRQLGNSWSNIQVEAHKQGHRHWWAWSMIENHWPAVYVCLSKVWVWIVYHRTVIFTVLWSPYQDRELISSRVPPILLNTCVIYIQIFYLSNTQRINSSSYDICVCLYYNSSDLKGLGESSNLLGGLHFALLRTVCMWTPDPTMQSLFC